MEKKYWLTPPELYEKLNEEFNFNFDPCPYPHPEWNGLEVEWGSRTFCNPPFKVEDGGPISRWIEKAFKEHEKGKTIVMLLPCHYHAKHILFCIYKDDPRIRFLGRIRYLDVVTKEPGPNPLCDSFLFILKNNLLIY